MGIRGYSFGRKKGGDLMNGLIAYYKWNNTVDDETGNNVGAGLLGGVGYASGIIDNCINVTAQNQSVEIPSTNDNFSFTNGSSDLPFTISTWVYPTGFSSSSNRVANKRFSGNEYHFVFNATAIQFVKWDNVNGGNRLTHCANSFSINNLYHMVVASDGITENIYVNGVKLSSSIIPTGTYVCMRILSSNKFYYAGYGGATNTSSLGKNDELAVWKNRCLSDSEVLSLYNSGSGLQYPF